jgi:hypothetical protein
LGLAASIGLVAWIVSVPGTATAFGTIDGAGQHREHERITRAALACAGGAKSNGDCFEPKSIDQLAGKGKAFGGVGAPDSDEISNPAAHCDDADYLERSGYPQTRVRATAGLANCVNHLRSRFREGVELAKGLLDARGNVVGGEVNLDPQCEFFGGRERRAKCESIEGFGRALHGAQDFYSHSNWADEADPARPIADDNPPGLNRPGPSPVLDLRGRTAPNVPRDLTTGCFVPRDEVPGVERCAGRITHAGLNKDNGLIDPVTGTATAPTTPRGMVRENFAKAVTGAINETRRQWDDFRYELTSRYGEQEAAFMICALTRDDPVKDCRDRAVLVDQLPGAGNDDRGWWVVAAVVVGAAVVVAAAFPAIRARRRRWALRRRSA